jgi:predicted transcriptional regulator
VTKRLNSALGEAQPLRRLRARRSGLEVRMDILIVVRDGAEGPTQIMAKSNLSWNLLTHHMKELVDHGIVSEHNIGERLVYRLTEKGINILRSYMVVVDEFNLADHYGMSPEQ